MDPTEQDIAEVELYKSVIIRLKEEGFSEDAIKKICEVVLDPLNHFGGKCLTCGGSGRQPHYMVGEVNCICGGAGTRLAELEGKLQDYHDRGY